MRKVTITISAITAAIVVIIGIFSLCKKTNQNG